MNEVTKLVVKVREYSRGQTMAEYALILAAVAVVVLGVKFAAVPPDHCIPVALAKLPPKLLTTALLAHTDTGAPALTQGPFKIVMSIVSVTAGHAPFPVDVRKSLTEPLVVSVGDGV